MKSAQGYRRSRRLKIFLFLGLWWPSCLSEQKDFSYFGMELSRQHSLKFESYWPKGSGEVSFFKANYSRFSIFSSGGHFVHQSETVSAILV